MIKLVALVRRKSDLSRRAFADYWINVHAPLAAAIPGMRGYASTLLVMLATCQLPTMMARRKSGLIAARR